MAIDCDDVFVSRLPSISVPSAHRLRDTVLVARPSAYEGRRTHSHLPFSSPTRIA